MHLHNRIAYSLNFQTFSLVDYDVVCDALNGDPR